MRTGQELRRFPDRYTFSSWGLKHDSSIPVLQSTAAGLIMAAPLPSLLDHHPNLALASLGPTPCILQPPQPLLPVFDSTGNGSSSSSNRQFVNANYVRFAGSLVVAWRSSASGFRLVAVPAPPAAAAAPPAAEASSTSSGIHKRADAMAEVEALNAFFVRYPTGVAEQQGTRLQEHEGEDPRLFLTGSGADLGTGVEEEGTGEGQKQEGRQLWVVFCQRHRMRRQELSMSFSQLVLSPALAPAPAPASAPAVSVLLTKVLDMQLPPKYKGRRSPQRNWSPLDHCGWPAFLSEQGSSVRVVQPQGLTRARMQGYEAAARRLHALSLFPPAAAAAAAAAGAGGGAGGQGGARERQAPESASETVLLKSISRSSTKNLTWMLQHGPVRGGTPAVRVRNLNSSMQDDDYLGTEYFLTFFHSSNEVPSAESHAASGAAGASPGIRFTKVLKTYRIGAMLLSTKPPYEVRRITPHPLVHDSMYRGAWALPPSAFHHMDYVVFPTNVGVFGDTLLLQYGWQDRETRVLEMSLQALMNGMVPVEQGPYDPPREGE